MKRVRFLMVGGFLGAGKTTAIARLARRFLGQGHKIGLVTNDQAYNLVDTQLLRAQGFRVSEVPGACFCCKFDDLVQTAAGLKQQDAPDMIIAEPVGSCTDLMATVMEPLRQLYGDQYEIGPLVVMLKPEHGHKILRHQQGTGFSPKAEYIFLKQIEEADVVVINKIDKLSREDRTELVQLVEGRFPEKCVLAASARHGTGFDALAQAIEKTPAKSRFFMHVDYDIYAEGEAELGWLNCQARLCSQPNEPFSLDELLVKLVADVRNALARSGGETAHLKVLGLANQQMAVANLVGSGADVELSLPSGVHTHEAELTINARVATDPQQLEQLVTAVIERVANQFQLTQSVTGMQRFRPARPVPTHRMTIQTTSH